MHGRLQGYGAMGVLRSLIRIGLFALILALGTAGALVAGETEGMALVGLSGASVQSVAASSQGNVMYAALTGGPQPAGIYRTDDSGRTWRVVSSGPGVAVNALAVHPIHDAVIYAGTAGGPAATADSLWRSDNGGETWHRFRVGLPADAYGQVPAVTALTMDPGQPDVLYVGTDGQGAYRFDLGRDIRKLLGGQSPYDGRIKGLITGPDGRVFALTNGGVFVSDGHAWQELDTLPELAVSLAVAANGPQVLYAGGTSTGLYRSSDGGRNWQPVSLAVGVARGVALRIEALVVDEHDAQHVVAATAYGLGRGLAGGSIYESQDAGESWVRLANTESVVTQLSIEHGIVYAASTAGLVRYGQQPRGTVPGISLPSPGSLVNPSGTKMLILVFTISLAGLALVGRTEWVAARRQAVA